MEFNASMLQKLIRWTLSQLNIPQNDKKWWYPRRLFLYGSRAKLTTTTQLVNWKITWYNKIHLKIHSIDSFVCYYCFCLIGIFYFLRNYWPKKGHFPRHRLHEDWYGTNDDASSIPLRLPKINLLQWCQLQQCNMEKHLPYPPCKGAVRSVEAKAFGNAIVDSFVRTDLQWNIFSLGDPKQQTNEPVKGYEKNNTHSAALLCCINFFVFFLLHRFCVVSKMLREKKPGPL